METQMDPQQEMDNRPDIIITNTGFVAKIQTLVESSNFQNFILFVIILNAITMGLQTSHSMNERFGLLLEGIDKAALVIFIIEILLKFIVYRLRFFTSGWNVFDFLVVGIAIAPNMGMLSVLRTLRTFRALRGLRILSMVPEMREVISALVTAIPGMTSIFGVMGLIFYIGAILATSLFGNAFPDWFGNLGASLYTLFQVMTLESWSMGIVRPVMEVYPWAWVFFVLFIGVTTFAVLNLFVAVLVNAMQTAHEAKQQAEIAKAQADVQELTHEMVELQQNETDNVKALVNEVAKLQQEIVAMRAMMEKR